MLRPLEKWFYQDQNTPWVLMERNITSPHKLEEILFCGLSPKYCQEKFGPIISYSIQTWQRAEKLGEWDVKWHIHTPIFQNKLLTLENKPLVLPSWSKCGIHTLSHIINNEGLRSFEDLRKNYNLPSTSFFFYLQLRSVIKANGVPWEKKLPIHPLVNYITTKPKGEGFVSYMYRKFQEVTCPSMGVTKVWNVDLKTWQEPINWKRVWENVSLIS